MAQQAEALAGRGRGSRGGTAGHGSPGAAPLLLPGLARGGDARRHPAPAAQGRTLSHGLELEAGRFHKDRTVPSEVS